MFQDTAGGHSAAVPATAPAAPSRRAKGIDRAAAARLLAEGRPIAEVARAVGCSRQNLWRQVQRSKRLARLIRSAEEEARTDAYGKLALLGPAAVETLGRALVDDDAGVAFKIADRMNLFERPDAADPTRHDVPAAWADFAELLAEVTERARKASRGGRIRFGPGDYWFFWNEARKAQAARNEPAPVRRVRAAAPPNEEAKEEEEEEAYDDAYDETDGEEPDACD